MKSIKQLVENIKKAKNILIISHIGPDGDTLGCMLALKLIFEKAFSDKNVVVICPGKIPEVYKFLPGSDLVKVASDEHLNSYDVAITVDCASIDRLGDALSLYNNSKCRVNIDHHVTNNGFGDINIIDVKAAATGEIIYEIAKYLCVEIDYDIAVNIYTAILTDTGGFKFENTSPKTFETAADLLRAGIKTDYVYKKCYESKPVQMIKIAAYGINNAVFCNDDKIVYTMISREDLKNFDASDDHLDGISETLRQVETVKVSMILKETPKGDTKVSLRSNGVDVCKIAEFFGGGGHKLAAGCTIQKNLNDSLNEILLIVKKQVKNAEAKKDIKVYS